MGTGFILERQYYRSVQDLINMVKIYYCTSYSELIFLSPAKKIAATTKRETSTIYIKTFV